MSSKHQKLSDDALIDRYIETQNGLYFNELYNRYADKIFAKCLTMLKEPTLAEDAAQEIFTKLFLKLSSFQKNAKFSTWVYAVTFNYCIDLIRRNKKMGHISSMDDEKSPQFADTNPELSDAAFLEMNVNKLAAAMEKIPTDDKTLLIMKYKDGVSIKELAEITNKTESAIKMKLKRAKDKVREHYDKILLLVLLIASGFRGQ